MLEGEYMVVKSVNVNTEETTIKIANIRAELFSMHRVCKQEPRNWIKSAIDDLYYASFTEDEREKRGSIRNAAVSIKEAGHVAYRYDTRYRAKKLFLLSSELFEFIGSSEESKQLKDMSDGISIGNHYNKTGQ